jgi:hypothetical protein
MLGWEVVKGKEDFFIFLQAFAGLWEFGLVTGDELIRGRKRSFAGRRQVQHTKENRELRVRFFGGTTNSLHRFHCWNSTFFLGE